MEAKSATAADMVFIRLFWVVPLSFYLFTVSRTPGWVDAPLIAKMVHGLELSTWVNNHNLFTVVGWVWLRIVPRSLDPHYALNLLCALFGALTVYVVALVGLRLTRNVLATGLGAACLMVSHSLWWHSTMLEVYTLSTLLISLVLLFVVRYEQEERFSDLCAAMFCFGLACSNHAQMALLGAGFVALMWLPKVRQDTAAWRSVVLLATSFFVGFQIYVWVFVSELIATLRSVPEAEPLVVLGVMLDRTTGGEFRRYMFPRDVSWSERFAWWAFYGSLFVYSFPTPWLLAAPLGAVGWLRSPEARVSFVFMGVALAAQVLWSANYFVWDMYAFALPAYVMTSVFIIVGIDSLFRKGRRLRRVVFVLAPTVLLVPFLYREAPTWLRSSGLAERALSMIPQYEQAKAFWDPVPYFFDPNRRSYARVERTARNVLEELEDDACFWGNEATILYPLEYYYQGVLGLRSDVSYHRVFGILEGANAYRYHAEALRRQLEAECRVYVASIGYPERYVLDFVAAGLEPTTPVAAFGRLPTQQFVETFPRYRLESINVDPESETRIYRFVPRPSE